MASSAIDMAGSGWNLVKEASILQRATTDNKIHEIRFSADRAKQIKTKAKVNEDPTEKLIRELKEENERLKKLISGGAVAMPAEDSEDEDDDKNRAITDEGGFLSIKSVKE